MAKRLFDICAASIGLVIAGPIIGVAAIAVRMTSRGPAFYHAARIGRDNCEFKMHKLRSMHVVKSTDSVITATGDPRVFVVGRILRALKIDELPQLWNVLKGEMSIVGPRPEDPKIVRDHYSTADMETLQVRPGLTSPGSIYNYTHGENLIDVDSPERCYVDRLLPIKLELERTYIRKSSLAYDIRLILRTISVLFRRAIGVTHFADPPELTHDKTTIEPNSVVGFLNPQTTEDGQIAQRTFAGMSG